MISPIIKLFRPSHWIKNIFVFLPLFFAGEIRNFDKLEQALWAFGLFCLGASTVYVVNDILDRKQDSKHPQKKKRPIPAGEISVCGAMVVAIFLGGVTMLITYFMAPQMFLGLGGYVFFNMVYSFWLKHVPIFDLIIVAFLYVWRVLVGGIVTDTFVSSWLILCILFGAMMLIVGKRLAEFSHKSKRRVLSFYTPALLDQFILIMATMILVTYSLYTVFVVSSEWGIYSVLFVMVGLLRYLQLAQNRGGLERPERLLLSDPMILGAMFAWTIFMYLIFYL